MKYVIMCGGNYPKWKLPRQLSKINGEILVERTIRLLRENGINDIAISTNNSAFNYLKVPILNRKNDYIHGSNNENKKSSCCWLNAFYQLEEPVCYLYGDVYFSDEAIETIVNTEVEDTMYFCVPDKQDIPNKDRRNAKGREPLAFKVVNYKKFNNAINDLLKMVDEGVFKDKIAPFSWHLYRYLNGMNYILTDWGEMNNIFTSKGNYVIINDYTTDVDSEKDIEEIEDLIKGGNMIKVEVVENFTYKNFDKIKKSLVRKRIEKEGWLYVGDTFECDDPTLKYLTGDNALNKIVVKVIEVIPETKNEESVTPIKNKETLKNEKIANEIVKNVKKSKKKKK